MTLIWICVYWVIGLLTAVLAFAAFSMLISVFVALSKLSGRPENIKLAGAYIFGMLMFGGLAWLGYGSWQWLSGRFPSSGDIGFWVGAAIGSFGSFKMVPQITHTSLKQTSGIEVE